MRDFAFTDGVSLFEAPGNGLRGNWYEPFEAGRVEDIERLAETYGFCFGVESRKKFSYFSKLNKKQREEYIRDREVEYL